MDEDDRYKKLLEWEENCRIRLEGLIRNDNKDEFVSYMKSLTVFAHGTDQHTFAHSQVFKLICLHRALSCATALLNGHTGFEFNLEYSVELSDSYTGDDKTPLAFAAETFCLPLTNLFLKHGADPCFDGFNTTPYIRSLPLSLALRAFCNHKLVRDFPAGGSVYKLFSLFWLPELKEPLDVIKLLASKTEQVTNVAVYAVEEWNLVKLAALLVVAWDKLVGHNIMRNTPICHLIWLQHAQESDEKKKEILRSMWDVLTLLEWSGNFVEQYRTTSMVKHEVVPLEVACQFLSNVGLPSEQKLLLLADLDRCAAGLQHEDKVKMEMYLPEEMKPKSITAVHEELHAHQKQELSTNLNRFAAELRLGDKVLLESTLLEKMCSNSMVGESIYIPPRFIRIDLGEYSHPPPFSAKLESIMELDDRDEFIKVMNELGSFGCSDSRNEHLRNVRNHMFSYDSANCAAAILAGNTESFCSFSDLTDVSWSFLHKAAMSAAPKLTALFLENGFSADLRRDCNEYKLNLQAALPLNVAVESIRAKFMFEANYDKKSVIDLLVLLCRSDCRIKLETIRLLVQKTSNVQFEFLRYLKEGKIIELCALLLVGCKELLPSAPTVHSLASSSLTRSAGMRSFSTSSGQVNLREDIDLLEWKGALSLIDIFEKIGDYLGAYVRLEQKKRHDQIMSEISWLFLRAGISETQISKVGDCFPSGFYVADHGSYRSTVKQPSQLKLLPLSTFPKQAFPNLLLKQRGCSFHSSTLEAATDLAPIPAKAKGLSSVLGRCYSPIRSVSVVAALKKGIRRI